MASHKPGSRLGTRMRGSLAEAYGLRGHHQSFLWWVYSPKADRDFALRSNIEYGHFLLAESDPDVEFVDYAPKKRVASIAGEPIGTIVDAEIKLKSGATVWREIKDAKELESATAARANLQILIQARAAEQIASRHEVLTDKEIFANPMRTRNWHRALPWLADARGWSLHTEINEVALLLRRERRIELQQVIALGAPDRAVLYVAAILRQVTSGFFFCDLDTKPFSVQSTFWLRT